MALAEVCALRVHSPCEDLCSLSASSEHAVNRSVGTMIDFCSQIGRCFHGPMPPERSSLFNHR